MAGDLVLVTGATGLIGFRTLAETLRAGYRVRAAVRRESAIDTIKNAVSVKPYVDNLEFAIVKDITADGAFDEALIGVVYVLHIASPLPAETDSYQRDIIEPALHGTSSILYSALKIPTIRRIVITSSIVVLGHSDGSSTNKVFTEKDLAPISSPPYPHSFAAYLASKSLAHAAEDKFVEERKPHFSLIRILPSYVLGRHELASSVESFMSSTNRLIFPPLLGKASPLALAGSTVHVDDVARAHVDALGTEKIKGNQDFLASSNTPDGITWDDAAEIVKREFPVAVRKGVFPFGGTMPTNGDRFDASKTERAMGWQFRDFEEQVKSAVGQYLELSGHEAA